MKVRIVHTRAFGAKGHEIEAEWPEGFRLPSVGERISTAAIGGFVEYIDWNLDTGVPTIYLR